MTPLADTTKDAGPPPSDGLALVGETKDFLKVWQRLLLGAGAWDHEQIAELREKCRELEGRARAADVRGLAHHLQSCEACFREGEIDAARLASCLRNVSEVAWQWRQDLRRRSDDRALEGQVSQDRLVMEAATVLEPPRIELFESAAAEGAPVEAAAAELAAPSAAQSSAAPEGDTLASRVPSAGAEPPPFAPFASGALGGGWAGAWRGAALRRRLRLQVEKRRQLAFPTLAGAVHPIAEPDSMEPASIHSAAFEREPVSWRRASLALLGVAALSAATWTFVAGESEMEGAAAASRADEEDAEPPRLEPRAVQAAVGAAHGYGGLESPELAALIDAQGERLLAAGVAACPGVGCGLVREARGLAAAPFPGAGEAPGSWLEGLERPGLGVADDLRVRQLVDFHTRHVVGREAFQELLFRCAPHREPIAQALERYGLPRELLALPMVVSDCVADEVSSGGARGLWQLSPEAAHAYHLRLEPGVVDERLDPAKATEAAVRLLDDLYRKAGSWELAFAAFVWGPLPLLARAGEAVPRGDRAAFPDLVASGGVPDEVARGVLEAQAFALILANLSRFRFEPAPALEPDATAEIEVPPGTRLGLVARAAGSSTTRIRELNPHMIGERVPDWPGEKFLLRVPRNASGRARRALPELLASADHADECVPLGFDWGRHRFTPAMASRCEEAGGRAP